MTINFISIPDGIIKQDKPTNIRTFVDMTGHVYGDLTVIDYYGKKKMRSYWACKCACGNYKVILRKSLVDGLTTSCGCAQKKAVTRHGLFKTPEYKIWRGMQDRCYLEKSANYHNYGGRGIKVCDRWLESIDNFVADMGIRPSPKYSLDRIDVNGDYSPENCRWADDKTQNRNRRDNLHITIRGDKMTIAEAVERYSLPRHIITWRMRQGWTDEEIIRTPVRPRGKGLMRQPMK